MKGVFRLFETIVGYGVAIFIFQPLSVLIHESGHAFFIKLFGGKVHKLEIGIGDPLFSIGLVQVNKQFFIMGLCRGDSNVNQNEKIKLSLIALGGVIFNLISIFLLILIKVNTKHHHFLDGYFFGFTSILILSALVPVTYFTGYKSDGRVLIDIWKKRKSELT